MQLEELKFTKEHEWVHIEGDMITIGITKYAQEAIGDIVFIELPENGKVVQKGDDFAVIESVKAASEIYSPANGTVIEINSEIETNTDLVKGDLEKSWIAKIKISDISELEDLMNFEDYSNYID